ncbi:MAG: hypothetical protein R3Y46_06535 [Opitutales bacterium]
MTRDDLPNAIAFYKSFFETENTPMEDKGSILIHETAHLAGLKSDKETKTLNSAEALRNFLLLCLEKVSPDDLFQTKDEANSDTQNTQNTDNASDANSTPYTIKTNPE